MSRKNDNALIVFLKYPEENMVKTRLGATLGNRRAREFYREAAEFIANSFRGPGSWETFFFYAPEERRKEILKWLGGAERSFLAQKGKSLGQRMSDAFGKCFSLGFGNVVIIGTDCVLVTEDDIETAFDLLSAKGFDAVLGPAADGGYYLLGLSVETDAVFLDIRWSTAHVFEETAEQLRKSGLSFAVMRKLADIDEAKDIRMRDIEQRDAELARRLSRILGENGKKVE